MDAPCRALVVDEEVLARNLAIRALTKEGFSCDSAVDGLEAHQMLEKATYDVVVTELCLPNLNGHALAVEILGLPQRPILVVLTGLQQPKLAKDLIVRGVDSVDFKPVPYPAFAAKVRGLVNRCRAQSPDGCEVSVLPPSQASVAASRQAASDSSPSRIDIQHKLKDLSKIVPVSQSALDVYNMSGSNAYSPTELAAAIARESALSVDVLRLVNSAFYNSGGAKIVDLEEAVVRIGYKRTGELALATSSMARASKNVLPWLNMDLAWRRGVAAGVAIDALISSGGHAAVQDGLFVAAIMHSMGRIALGMLFPQDYPALVEACNQRLGLLADEERRAFQVTHAEVASRLLEAWNIPAGVYGPLRYLSDDYGSLSRVAEPLRTKVELLKLAVLIGRIAMGPWEPWERVELPTPAVLRRLNVTAFSPLVEKTKADAENIISFGTHSVHGKKAAPRPAAPEPSTLELPYCNLSWEPFDVLAELLTGMGMVLRPCDGAALATEKSVLVNCLGTPPDQAAPLQAAPLADGKRLIIANADHLPAYAPLGKAIAPEGSYAAFRAACQAIAVPVKSASAGDQQTAARPELVAAK